MLFDSVGGARLLFEQALLVPIFYIFDDLSSPSRLSIFHQAKHQIIDVAFLESSKKKSFEK